MSWLLSTIAKEADHIYTRRWLDRVKDQLTCWLAIATSWLDRWLTRRPRETSDSALKIRCSMKRKWPLLKEEAKYCMFAF